MNNLIRKNMFCVEVIIIIIYIITYYVVLLKLEFSFMFRIIKCTGFVNILNLYPFF